MTKSNAGDSPCEYQDGALQRLKLWRMSEQCHSLQNKELWPEYTERMGNVSDVITRREVA